MPFESLDRAIQHIRAPLTSIRQGSLRWRTLDAMTHPSDKKATTAQGADEARI